MSFNTSFNYSFFAQTAVSPNSIVVRPGQDLETTNRSGNIKVKLYPSWYKQIAVEWSVPSDWGNCMFNVYFSQGEDGPFEKITSSPISTTNVLDVNSKEYRKFDRGFYVVEAILKDRNNVSIRSNPKSWGSYQRDWVALRSLEIQRREYFLLSRFNGVKSYLFRKLNYGNRCPACWNYGHQVVAKDNCEVCYGTGFERGYMDATPLYINYSPSTNANVKSYFGVAEPNQIEAWTISIPEIHPDDIIIKTGEWSVYSVAKLVPTTLQDNPVRQILQLTQMGKKDVENKLISRNLPEFPSQYL